jgi:ABC-type polysaccharide/polyol phosphate export permease
MSTADVYDSRIRERPVVGEARSLWSYRSLLGLLVRHDVFLRYKRSALGIGWTFLNPLLYMGVLWVVFSSLFRTASVGVPYVVYLIAGVLVATLFSQVVVGVASSMVASTPVLTKIYVPPAVFATAAAIAAVINAVLSLVPMLVIMVCVGVLPSATAVFVFIPLGLLTLFAMGIGLALAPMAARFQDALELTGVFVVLATYLAPVFWPFVVAPERFRGALELHPLYHVLLTFRALLYEGSFGPWTSYAAMLVAASLTLALGSWLFSRTWRRSIASL